MCKQTNRLPWNAWAGNTLYSYVYNSFASWPFLQLFLDYKNMLTSFADVFPTGSICRTNGMCRKTTSRTGFVIHGKVTSNYSNNSLKISSTITRHLLFPPQRYSQRVINKYVPSVCMVITKSTDLPLGCDESTVHSNF